MGEARNRRRYAGVPTCDVDERATRGVFPLPSGKRVVLLLPLTMSAEDVEMAALALTKCASELVGKLPPVPACGHDDVYRIGEIGGRFQDEWCRMCGSMRK